MLAGQGRKAADARVLRTRAEVARTALAVLTEEGSDALTHARVAEIAGFSKTTLYAHWPSRLDLAAAALDILGELPSPERTGDLRTDLVDQLTSFRQGVTDHRLDRVLAAMAQWATIGRESTPRGSGPCVPSSKGPSTALNWRRSSPCSAGWSHAPR